MVEPVTPGGGRSGDDDDVAGHAAADAQEFFFDLGDHGVGRVDVGAEEGFDAPGEVELGAGGGVGGEGEQGDG